jgi:tetratricopeptide (TPR) repeat protein
MKDLARVPVLLAIFLSVNIQLINALDGNAYIGKGKLIDTVRCNNNPKYSYALYLPGKYSDKVKWPIIYIFDPGAGGKLALSRFIPAAEKYGYIAVCSNDSKNFLSNKELDEAINSMFVDTHARFTINTERIYTAGFSGGSRVAAMIALNNKNISGVIGCGAGFPSYADFINSPSFIYFGIVGNRDMNYIEMCDLEKKLDNQGMTAELRIFNGGHTWPSPELLEEAVEWLDLKAMYKGTKNKDPDFIDELFSKYNKKAESLSEQGKFLESLSYYRYIINDFPDHLGISKIKVKLDSLLLTKSYTNSLKAWNKNRSMELEMQNDFIKDLNIRTRTETLPDSIRNWWKGRIKNLRSMEVSKDSDKQVIASRVLMMLSVACYETGRNYLNLKSYRTASICFQLALLIEPENKVIHFFLARAYALNGETDEALRSLSRAIKAGYGNRQSIEKDSAFIPLRNKKQYREILMQLK